MLDEQSLVSSVPGLQTRVAYNRPRRGFARFLFLGMASLAFIAALQQGIQQPTLPTISLDMPRLDLDHLFAHETIFVTPGNSVSAREQAMPASVLMARWEPVIQDASRKFHIPAQWIRAVMRQESGGRTVLADNSPIISAAGAMGVMQVMPGTYSQMAAQYRLGDDPFEPRDNIYAGAAYLNWLHHKYGYPAMFAAYNDGPGNIEDHLYHGRPLPAETRGYIASIARFLRDKTMGLRKVALTQPDGVKVAIDPAKVTAVLPAAPGIYAPQVHAVISIGKIRRGVRENVADATALLRDHGAPI